MRLHQSSLLSFLFAISTMPLGVILGLIAAPSVLAQSVPAVDTSVTTVTPTAPAVTSIATPNPVPASAIATPAPVLYPALPVNYPVAYPVPYPTTMPGSPVYPGGAVYPLPSAGQPNPNGMSVQVNIGVPGGVPGQATYPTNLPAQPVYPSTFPAQGVYPGQAVYPAPTPVQGSYPVLPGPYPYPPVATQGGYPTGIYTPQPAPVQANWNSAAIAGALGNSQWLQKLVEADRLYRSGQIAQAEQLYRDAMVQMNAQYPTQYPTQATALKAQIEALSQSKRWAEAAILARQFALSNTNSTLASEFEKLAQDNLKRAQTEARRKATGNLLGTVLRGGLGYLLTGKAPDAATTLQSILGNLSELRQSRNPTFP